jgi:hypothetical protein
MPILLSKKEQSLLRFVLNFEFRSFGFVSDFGFSASDLVAVNGRAKPFVVNHPSKFGSSG